MIRLLVLLALPVCLHVGATNLTVEVESGSARWTNGQIESSGGKQGVKPTVWYNISTDIAAQWQPSAPVGGPVTVTFAHLAGGDSVQVEAELIGFEYQLTGGEKVTGSITGLAGANNTDGSGIYFTSSGGHFADHYFNFQPARQPFTLFRPIVNFKQDLAVLFADKNMGEYRANISVPLDVYFNVEVGQPTTYRKFVFNMPLQLTNRSNTCVIPDAQRNQNIEIYATDVNTLADGDATAMPVTLQLQCDQPVFSGTVSYQGTKGGANKVINTDNEAVGILIEPGEWSAGIENNNNYGLPFNRNGNGIGNLYDLSFTAKPVKKTNSTASAIGRYQASMTVIVVYN